MFSGLFCKTRRPAGGFRILMASSLTRRISSDDKDPPRKIGRFPSGIQLHHPIRENGIFKNPWKTWEEYGMTAILSVLKIFATEMRQSGEPHKDPDLDAKLPIVKPDFTPNADGSPKLTWIGHATVVLQMEGVTVLTDPIWSRRCSPVQFFGTSRYRPPPCTIEDLPEIDAVVISHNHYDHLDVNTVKQLNKRFGTRLRWYVPMNTKSWMEATGCENVVEMNWWDEEKLPGTDVVFAFTPSQHHSKRGLFDYCKQLWGSWCIISPRYRFFFGGDTGYCEGFKEIGAVYGPFDISAIPIGAYEPRWFMKFAHANPEESVQIHHDIRSKKSLGIHWGTFVLTTEHYLEPPQRLRSCLEQQGLSSADFDVVQHGGSMTLGS